MHFYNCIVLHWYINISFNVHQKKTSFEQVNGEQMTAAFCIKGGVGKKIYYLVCMNLLQSTRFTTFLDWSF